MITKDIKKQILEAMKARDQVRLSTLKMLSSELHNQEINLQHELNDEEEIAVVRKEVKKRKDAIEAYKSAGSEDKANSEEAEMKVLEEFLPAEMDDTELAKIVDEAISATGASSMADMGKVMGAAMSKLQGKVNGNRVSSMVKDKLSS